MPPVEWIVDVMVRRGTLNQLIRAPVEVGDDEVLILAHALVHAVLLVGRAKSTVDPVLVRPPHVGQSLLNVVSIGSSSQISWQEKHQSHILHLELEQCCKKKRMRWCQARCLIAHLRDLSVRRATSLPTKAEAVMAAPV